MDLKITFPTNGSFYTGLELPFIRKLFKSARFHHNDEIMVLNGIPETVSLAGTENCECRKMMSVKGSLTDVHICNICILPRSQGSESVQKYEVCERWRDFCIVSTLRKRRHNCHIGWLLANRVPTANWFKPQVRTGNWENFHANMQSFVDLRLLDKLKSGSSNDGKYGEHCGLEDVPDEMCKC